MTATDLDLAVGSIIWDGTTVNENHMPTRGGMVVDSGLTEQGEPYVEVLDERCIKTLVQSREPSAKQWRSHRPAGLSRIMLSDIDPATIEEPSIARMHGWAQKALFGAALGGNSRPRAGVEGQAALVYAAGTLWAETQRMLRGEAS